MGRLSLLNDEYEMLSAEEGLIPNDVRIRLRVAKAYEKWGPANRCRGQLHGADNF